MQLKCNSGGGDTLQDAQQVPPQAWGAAEGSVALTAVWAAEPNAAHVDFYVIWHSARTPGEPVLSLHLQALFS